MAMMNEAAARRIPVIVGVGQLNDRPDDDADALDTLALMVAALQRADHDAGGGFLRQLQSLGIVEQMSWPTAHWPGPHKITPHLLAALGIAPAHVELTPEPSGDSPLRLPNDAANRIGAGEVAVAAVVGGEALRTAARRAASSGAPQQDLIRAVTEQRAGRLKQQYGLLTPTDVYPLYENACRAAWGQTLAQAQAETAAIWAGLSAAATDNPGAWIRRRHEPDELLAASAHNRLVSFPYNKLMVANSSVNQGAAVIVASLAKAREMGVPDEQLVYLGAGASAHEPEDILARERYDGSPAMAVSIQRALALNGLTVRDLDLVELYSCFPCVPKMARRILPWPLERRHSVYGGLTFGGGPIGNCMTHAVAAMALLLRRTGRHGLVYANGGFATHHHTLVLTREPVPAGRFPQHHDHQAEADAQRGTVPALIEGYTGPGVVETYMAPCDRAGQPLFSTVIARTPGGQRFLSRVPSSDGATLAALTSGEHEPVGRSGVASASADGFVDWRFSASQGH